MKVLLINPKKEDSPFCFPHNGLAQLSSALKQDKNEVLIIDYSFLYNETRDINYFVDSYKPDVIGISLYTLAFKEGIKIIKKIRKANNNIPIIVGGAHPTLYFEDLEKEKDIDYIVIGEAELIINDLVKYARRQDKPEIVRSAIITDIDNLPLPDFTSFYDYKNILIYPLMTSRGCPFKCSFCASSTISRKWRSRDPEKCIEELKLAKKIFQNIKVIICDDNPTADKNRFKRFLKLYIDEIGNELSIINTRADGIDDELLILLKKCGVNNIAIGVESANEEVSVSPNEI